MAGISLNKGIPVIKGFGLNAFSNEELDTIHLATLHLFKEVGILVESEQAAELFRSAGAKTQKADLGWLIKIPSYMIKDCLSAAPNSITYHGRVIESDYTTNIDGVGFAQFGECVNIIDPHTRQLRPSVKKDCHNTAVLADALDEIRIMERSVCPGDQTPQAQPLHNLEAIISGTGKHIVLGTGGRKNLEAMIQLGRAAAGGTDQFNRRPFFTPTVCPLSPLSLVNSCCDTIICAAENNLGVLIISMCLAGGTAPVTLAGTVVQHNVEVLSALMLAQLVKKGTPCTYGSCTSIMDLKTGVAAIGAPEYGMLNAAIAKMAQYYKLPCFVGGGLSDAKEPDTQSGYEFAINALTSALAGANIVFGGGGLDLGMTFDYAKLLLDHECMRNIQYVLRGISVSSEDLALEVISQVGPGKSYLAHPHTFKHVRTQSQANLFNRQSRQVWEASGKNKSILERSYQKAIQIIDTHQPPPLPRGAEEQMEAIVKEFEAEIAGS